MTSDNIGARDDAEGTRAGVGIMVGVTGIFANTEIEFDRPDLLPDDFPDLAFEVDQGALGALVEYDGRNSTFTATSGTQARATADLFREGQGIVAEGSITPDGQFVASRVLAKHDENYMSVEVKAAMDAAERQRVMGQAQGQGDGSET